MKKADLVQIKGLSNKELMEKVKTIKREITDMAIDKNMNKLKDTKVVFKKRKDLAQVLTVLRQKQLIEQLESNKEKGGKQTKIVMDNLVESAK